MADHEAADGDVDVEVPQDLRMTETVHIANPTTGSVEVLKKSQQVPDWAVDLLPPGLAEEATPGALPLSMTGGLQKPAGNTGNPDV